MKATWRDGAVLVLVAAFIALAGFVQARNRAFEHTQRERAVRALDVKTADIERYEIGLVPAAGLVVPRTWRPTPFTEPAKPLGAGTAPTDDDQRTLYDLATAPTLTPPYVDAIGRGIATRRAPDGTTWITRTLPGRPAPLPWLPLLGAVALAAGALTALGGRGRRAAAFGLNIAGLAFASLAVIWGSAAWAPIAIAILTIVVAALHGRGTSDRFADGVRAHRVALAFVAPTAIAMGVLVLVPFAVGIVLGFFDHHHGSWTFVGLANFGEILSGGGRALSDPLNFWFVLAVTLLWTFANIFLHVTIGVALALLLTRPWLRGRGVLRMLLILPWAIPNYITALVWKGMFAGEYGAINRLLEALGVGHVGWFSSWSAAFTANVTTNTWMGFPFMMVIAIGALEGIPKDLYEAAAVDGASRWQAFRLITLPHLRVAMAPAVALGTIWTFNMFNVIFLVSAGKPGGSTNILVTDAYRWAFERGERYGMAAAYATIIFIILLAWTGWNGRRQRRRALGASA